MSSKIEIEAEILAVEIVRNKIQNAKTIEEAMKIMDQNLESSKVMLKNAKEEINLNHDFYEEVTVKIPKSIMDLLRNSESITGDSPTMDIEYAVVESVRARIDGGQFLPTRETLLKQYNLEPLFKSILE